MNSRREKVFLSPLLKWGRGLRKSDKSSCWLTSENVKRLEIEGEIKHLLGIENSKLAEEGGCGLSASWSVPFPALLNVPDPPFFFSIFLENISTLGKPVSFDCLVYLNVLASEAMTVMTICLEQPWGLSRGQLSAPAGQSPKPSPASHLSCHLGSSGLSATASFRAVVSGQLWSFHMTARGETRRLSAAT